MTTLDLTVHSDAHEDHTGANFSSSAAIVNCNAHTSGVSNRQYRGGFEFVLTAEIPSGATIDAAYMTIHANSTAVDDPNVNIRGEDTADAPDFATNADVTSRTRTTASVQWTTTAIGTGASNTPSLVSILQELVDDYGGLANGASIVIFFDGRNDAISSFQVMSIEGTGTEAALHIEFTAGGGTITEQIGLVTETDTALAVAAQKMKAAGQAAETDSAQPVTAVKSKTAGQPGETDTAQPVSRTKAKAAGLASESDTALPLTNQKTKTAGLVSEGDTAQPVTARKAAVAGQASESDSALPVARIKRKAIGQATETNTALAFVIGDETVVAIGIVSETDTALPVARVKRKAIGIATETATALSVLRVKTAVIGLATETDTALAFVRSDLALAIYAALVYVNLSPTAQARVNITPTVSAAANPTPAKEAVSG